MGAETILSPTQQQRRKKDSNVLRKKSSSTVASDAPLLPTAQQLLSQFTQLIQRTLINNDITAQRLI